MAKPKKLNNLKQHYRQPKPKLRTSNNSKLMLNRPLTAKVLSNNNQ